MNNKKPYMVDKPMKIFNILINEGVMYLIFTSMK